MLKASDRSTPRAASHASPPGRRHARNSRIPLAALLAVLAVVVSSLAGLGATEAVAAEGLSVVNSGVEYMSQGGTHRDGYRDVTPTVARNADGSFAVSGSGLAPGDVTGFYVATEDDYVDHTAECSLDAATGDVTVPASLAGRAVHVWWDTASTDAKLASAGVTVEETPSEEEIEAENSRRAPAVAFLASAPRRNSPIMRAPAGPIQVPSQMYLSYYNANGDPTVAFQYGGQGTRGRFSSVDPNPDGKAANAQLAICLDPGIVSGPDDGKVARATVALDSYPTVDQGLIRSIMWFGPSGPGYDQSMWDAAGLGNCKSIIPNAPNEWDAQIVVMHVLLADRFSHNSYYAMNGMSQQLKDYFYRHVLGNDANGQLLDYQDSLCGRMDARRGEVPDESQFKVFLIAGSNRWQRFCTFIYNPGPKTTSFDLRKVWQDGDGAHRPASIDVRLVSSDGAGNKTVTLDAQNGWSYHEDDVPLGRTYTATEVFSDTTHYKPPVYDGQNSLSITITNSSIPTTGLDVSKVWKNAADGHPSSVSATIKAQANGVDTGWVRNVTLSESNGWHVHIDDLPAQTDDGTQITYNVTEDDFPGSGDYLPVQVEQTYNTVTLVNAKKAKKELSVTKVWSGGSASDQASSIAFDVVGKAGGETVYTNTLTLSAANSWYGSISGLPATDENGSDITYSVTEGTWTGGNKSAWQDEPDIAQGGSDGSYVFTVTNKAKPGHLRITKQVSGTSDATKEFQVVVHLSDGTTSTATLHANQTTQIDIPSGLSYWVDETSLPRGYKLVSVTGGDSGHGTGTIEAGQTDSVTVSNSYAAEGDWAPQSFKRMLQRDLTAGEFSFTLRDADSGRVLQSGRTNSAAGVVTFDKIHFTDADVDKPHHYTVTEDAGSDPTVAYSTTTYAYTVTPHDDGQGGLDFDEDCKVGSTSATPVFTNSLKPGSLQVEKRIRGNNPDPDTKFTFKVQFSTPEGTTLPRDGSGTIPFTRYRVTTAGAKRNAWSFDEGEDEGDGNAIMTVRTVAARKEAENESAKAETDPEKVVVANTADGGSIDATPAGGTLVGTNDGVSVYAFRDADSARKAADELSEADGVSATQEVAFTTAEDDDATQTPSTVAPATSIDAAAQDVPDYSGQNVIALIDTGANEGDPNVVARYSVVGDDGHDANGHGTEMAAYVHDTYPEAKVVSIKAMDDGGHGTLTGIVSALKLAERMNARVVNLSLTAPYEGVNKVLDDELSAMHVEHGMFVTAAAGNYGRNVDGYTPANSSQTLAAGSCDESGNRRDFSNWGDDVFGYVTSDSTSEASARLAALVSRTLASSDDLNDLDASGILFQPVSAGPTDHELSGGTPFLNARQNEELVRASQEDPDFTVQSNTNGPLTSWLNSGSLQNDDYIDGGDRMFIISPTNNTSAYVTAQSVSGNGNLVASTSWYGSGFYNENQFRRQLWQFHQSDKRGEARTWRTIVAVYGDTGKLWWDAQQDNDTGGVVKDGSKMFYWQKDTPTENEIFGTDTNTADSTMSFVPYANVNVAATYNGSGNVMTTKTRTANNNAGYRGSTDASQRFKLREAQIQATFDGAGGTVVGATTAKWSFKQRYVLPRATRNGYTLKGWVVSGRLTDHTYSPGESVYWTSVEHNGNDQWGSWGYSLNASADQKVTFTAQWEKNVVYHSISYNGNGSGAYNVPSATSGIEEGTSASISSTRPRRAGYTFTGWNTDRNGWGTSYSPGQYIPSLNSDLTLYAQWTEERSYLEFDANGGSGGPGTQSEATSSTAYFAIPSAKPYRFGYTFAGWATSRNGRASYQPGDTVAVGAGDTTTLYAVWTPDSNDATVDGDTITFQLKGGEGARFDNLPANTTYVVWEETPAGWQVVDSSDLAGTIRSNQTSSEYVTNRYEPNNLHTSAIDLKGIKKVDGKNDTKGGYQFQLLENGSVIGTTTSDSNGAFVFRAFGPNAIAQLNYTSVGTHTYTIKEVAGSDDTMSYDSHSETVTVNVTSDGSGLRASPIYDSDGAVFDNTHKPGSLTITKRVTGTTDASTPFSFTLALAGQAPQTFTLRAGESKTFDGLVPGTAYEVTEANPPSGYTLTGIENGTGTVQSGQAITVTATNDYGSRPVKVRLSATKAFEGATLRDGQFSFSLAEGGKVFQTKTNSADGSVAFDEITYYEPGEHDYEIREVAGTDASIAYDTHVAKAHVKVTDDVAGQLVADVTYTSAGFTNTYQQGTLSITKHWEHGTHPSPATTPTFDITLRKADGTAYTGTIPTTLGAASFDLDFQDGKAVLARPMADGDTAQLTIPYGYTYTVSERAIDGYSTTHEGPESGTISAKASAVAYTNSYTSSGTWTAQVRKSFPGKVLVAGQFTFQLRDADGNVVDTARNAADGTVTFKAREITPEMLRGSETYTISEVVGDDDTLSYDRTVIPVTVRAEDDGHGHRVADVRYYGSTLPATLVNMPIMQMPLSGYVGLAREVALGIIVVAAGVTLAVTTRHGTRRDGGDAD